MKKKLILLSLIGVAVLLAVVLAMVATPGGISVNGVEYGGTDRTLLGKLTVDFFEDIQFKDFQSAATFHLAATQAKRDIPAMIQRVFSTLKPEALDIQRYKVLDVDLDRSGKRGRTRTQLTYRLLGDERVAGHAEALRQLEMMLYWFKQPDGSWAMELESSLR
jgi:hypothetical protein